jgi:anthranilate phosphoribosyltransferase
MNTAALLVVAGKAKDEKAGVRLARESISSGRGLTALYGYRDAAQQAMKEEEEDDSRNDM